MIRDDPRRQNAWSTWVLRQWRLVRPSPNMAMLYMAVLIGIGAGIGAICFSWLVDSVTDLAFNRGGNLLSFLGPYYVILIPAMGGLIVGPIVFYFAREAKGHGVPEVMEAVAVSVATAAHAHNVGLDHIHSVQQRDPMHRADELYVEIGPVHAPRDGNACQSLLDDCRQQRQGRFTDLGGTKQQPTPVGVLETFQVVDVNAAGTGESLRRPGRLSIRVESGVQGRTATLDITVWLIHAHVWN